MLERPEPQQGPQPEITPAIPKEPPVPTPADVKRIRKTAAEQKKEPKKSIEAYADELKATVGLLDKEKSQEGADQDEINRLQNKVADLTQSLINLSKEKGVDLKEEDLAEITAAEAERLKGEKTILIPRAEGEPVEVQVGETIKFTSTKGDEVTAKVSQIKEKSFVLLVDAKKAISKTFSALEKDENFEKIGIVVDLEDFEPEPDAFDLIVKDAQVAETKKPSVDRGTELLEELFRESRAGEVGKHIKDIMGPLSKEAADESKRIAQKLAAPEKARKKEAAAARLAKEERGDEMIAVEKDRQEKAAQLRKDEAMKMRWQDKEVVTAEHMLQPKEPVVEPKRLSYRVANTLTGIGRRLGFGRRTLEQEEGKVIAKEEKIDLAVEADTAYYEQKTLQNPKTVEKAGKALAKILQADKEEPEIGTMLIENKELVQNDQLFQAKLAEKGPVTWQTLDSALDVHFRYLQNKLKEEGVKLDNSGKVKLGLFGRKKKNKMAEQSETYQRYLGFQSLLAERTKGHAGPDLQKMRAREAAHKKTTRETGVPRVR